MPATDAEVTAAGYALPAGQDAVAGGDDAIRQNARAAHEGFLAHAATLGKVIGTPAETGLDLDTLTSTEVVSLPASGMSITGGPYPDPVGTLVVHDTGNSTGNIQTQLLIAYNPARLYLRDRNSAGFWQAWREVAMDEAARVSLAGGRREAVVSAGLARRGGAIGTGGRPAVAIRFDHHTGPFLSKVLPLLRTLGLPWGQMLNANRLGRSGTETGTAAQMQAACLDSGGEAWNHSWSHSDVVTAAQADREVTRGLSDLRAALPRVWIDGWAGPGQTAYMGLEGSDTVDKWWSTETGRRVLAQHAFVRGYYQGVHTHLAGPNLIGAPHVTIDAQTRAWCLSALSAVAVTGRGLTMMLHPNYLDQAGYLTTADLTAILSDIAARRDRGELEVLTPSGILMADTARPRGTHLDGAIEAGTVPSGGITTTPSSRTWLSTVGVPHEAGVTLSGSGTATLTVTITTPSGNVTNTRSRNLTGDPRRLVVPITPPVDATGVTITLTAPTGTQHLGLTYRPI